jgi:hypothetical protein
MPIGLRGWDDPKQVTWLPGLLAMPFHGSEGEYAINQRRWERPAEPGTSDERD